jgi:hypothetical protein
VRGFEEGWYGGFVEADCGDLRGTLGVGLARMRVGGLGGIFGGWGCCNCGFEESDVEA